MNVSFVHAAFDSFWNIENLLGAVGLNHDENLISVLNQCFVVFSIKMYFGKFLWK